MLTLMCFISPHPNSRWLSGEFLNKPVSLTEIAAIPVEDDQSSCQLAWVLAELDFIEVEVTFKLTTICAFRTENSITMHIDDYPEYYVGRPI